MVYQEGLDTDRRADVVRAEHKVIDILSPVYSRVYGNLTGIRYVDRKNRRYFVPAKELKIVQYQQEGTENKRVFVKIDQLIDMETGEELSSEAVWSGPQKTS